MRACAIQKGFVFTPAGVSPIVYIQREFDVGKVPPVVCLDSTPLSDRYICSGLSALGFAMFADIENSLS